MYEQVGQLHLPDLLDWPLCWNPPGWGSYSSLALIRDLGLFPTARLAMVVGIRPGGYIPFHVDDPAAENAIPERLERRHVVLATNPQCWNFHGGTWQQLERGGVYRMDPYVEHASINLGQTMRLHLVVDLPCERHGSE